jgi:hypothetical protein
VYGLTATIGDRTIKTEVKPKAEAQAEFNAAVQQGHTAVMAKQEETTQVRAGQLGPSCTAGCSLPRLLLATFDDADLHP